MVAFLKLLRDNPNYRYTWMGQVVSEVGDHFNNIAVFDLALRGTSSGMAVSGVMLARAISAVLAGPVAGVVLDRFDRKTVMIASDLVRAVVAAAFILTIHERGHWLLYLLSALLMFASPFFTSGRSSILPTITTTEELHTANTVTQTTQWTTLAIGAMLAGASVSQLGFEWAFALNALSFLFSAFSIARLRAPKGAFRVERTALTESEVVRPWHEYTEGLRYMRQTPLILGIAMVGIGWATGGGAAQILFGMFGEVVFKRGALGIGEIWACAGVGLLLGGVLGHWFGNRATFRGYKRSIAIAYVVHGGAYVLFSQVPQYALALVFIALSRFAVGMTSVLNMTQLLRRVPNAFRGRVFATMESLVWFTMIVSMAAAGIASQTWGPRTIGLWSGIFSSSTALIWGFLDWTGRLPEPAREGVERDEVEVHGDPAL